MREQHEYPRGFSLIELMVAMAVTLIVTGAIYGLMTGGQNAFRREPAIADRQQNIRMAMDLIMRDIAGAGLGLPAFAQAFTPGLNSCAACPAAPGGAATPGGTQTDDLEILTNPSGQGMEPVCGYAGNAVNAALVGNHTRIHEGDVFMVLLADGTWTMRAAIGEPTTNNTQRHSCVAGEHADVNFRQGGDTSGYNTGGICDGSPVYNGSGACVGCSDAVGTACCSPLNPNPDLRCVVLGFLGGFERVQYQIRPDANGVPNLRRFSSADPGAGFQEVARGIDDLQVQYTNANGDPPSNDAPQVDPARVNYGSLIRDVTVTLSARSEEQNVAGIKLAAAGPNALRGQLTSTGTPRAVLDTLGTRTTQRAGWAPTSTPAPWY